MKGKKILIVAPHMDDEVLGCGGVIAKHVACGDKVTVIFIAHRIYGHVYDKEKSRIEEAHALKAKKVLGYKTVIFLDLPDERLDGSVQDIIIPLEKQACKTGPDTVYLPFRGDNHQDHRAVFDAARVVFRPAANPSLKNIYMYEVPSSTEQSPPMAENAFLPNYYVDISPYMKKKIDALMCYETEKRSRLHPRSEKGLEVLARKRGTEIGFEYAESFMILREKWA